ncbi:MAG: type I glyceraldehyde-3-phosphate dehydrogenase [Candidatus Magasanikbacteria bacterium RIFCSPHIGHO2_01_FULL_33_34]|uniref:Type I glyceraldehyde-3-phosphate dehydrogenase n=1 Tax=Candidatus Magasanikbacteria bacterium RIFCSPHIGHO2_01_FULL_33_34 TaxID=1798671 RepID=A0A1F6LH08_9BACT|nr:MAG: type I glyceraldehyde-3-phosphate dehydrogenase [Candidatus Magasanikbacteria bacterium RIFCSPHIGHO2_01_FULL_33_34]OGH66197.1 MAG: type I glyceraldehyde-3-phosphate dehydrogenase [Candidatus Magasanikbacteria bacterium RIFCSPHIGHO2_02_FULL_33_17]OGH76043.1 MAG: type I glyceraldehyde-3-phosphate dehydrogenase [Candidatus Magasanikbacteria bacterium RIFCSPLOWO2_01_FULL_33_34]
MSKIKLAINGFGRIGRHAFKVAVNNKNIEIVAINDLTDTKTIAHLLKYDTAYSRYTKKVTSDSNHLIVNGKKIKVYATKEPAKLPWKELGVDVVLECTGAFRTKEKAGMHLKAGAKKVIISAPSKGDGVQGFVCGVNSDSYNNQNIIDIASCTTNCAGPVVDIINRKFGIEKGFLTTVHSYTADQNLQDGPHKDLRRARAAAQNIVPTSTGAALAVTRVIPELVDKFDGMAIRVPTITVSLTDFVFLLKDKATVESINNAFKRAEKTYLKGILSTTDEPLVSSDFVGDQHSAIVDLTLTKVLDGNLVKVIAWYDNEWGYANRLVEMAVKIVK